MIEVTALADMLARVGRLDLAARKKVAGLPPARADVFPAALATLTALADVGQIHAFSHSLRNLRWGVVAELSD